MISYAEFKTRLNERIREDIDFNLELLETVIKNPRRYTGIFRISNNKNLDMHSCAAVARNVKAKRLNGFDYWYVIRDGKLISIKQIREEYRKMKVA